MAGASKYNAIERRQLERLSYRKPRAVLFEVIPDIKLLYGLKKDGTPRFTSKYALEAYHAGIIGWGLDKTYETLGHRDAVWLAMGEFQDCDCVLRADVPNEDRTETKAFSKIQLKYVPPEDGQGDLQLVLDKAKVKYHGPDDLILALLYNKSIPYRFEHLDLRGLNVQQLYICSTPRDDVTEIRGAMVSDLRAGLIHRILFDGIDVQVRQHRFDPKKF